MEDSRRIRELIDRWKAGHKEGRTVSPEDLCRDCPELLCVVKEEIADLRFAAEIESFAGIGGVTGSNVAAGYPRWSNHKHSIGDKFGRYELETFLAAGGYGQVWRASDPDLPRYVAIKIMPRGERALEEAQKVAQLDHPGIVPVYDVGHQDASVYFVSKLINGPSLWEHLEEKRLSKRESVRIATDVADSLHYAHTQGFIHRDVKPGNILLDQDLRVFLTDFGIVITAEQSLDPRDASCGTLPYMSPEQVCGNVSLIDRRTDIYSLGVVLFEMLTCKQPFRGDYRELQDKTELLTPIRQAPTQLTRASRRNLRESA